MAGGNVTAGYRATTVDIYGNSTAGSRGGSGLSTLGKSYFGLDTFFTQARKFLNVQFRFPFIYVPLFYLNRWIYSVWRADWQSSYTACAKNTSLGS